MTTLNLDESHDFDSEKYLLATQVVDLMTKQFDNKELSDVFPYFQTGGSHYYGIDEKDKMKEIVVDRVKCENKPYRKINNNYCECVGTMVKKTIYDSDEPECNKPMGIFVKRNEGEKYSHHDKAKFIMDIRRDHYAQRRKDEAEARAKADNEYFQNLLSVDLLGRTENVRDNYMKMPVLSINPTKDNENLHKKGTKTPLSPDELKKLFKLKKGIKEILAKIYPPNEYNTSDKSNKVMEYMEQFKDLKFILSQPCIDNRCKCNTRQECENKIRAIIEFMSENTNDIPKYKDPEKIKHLKKLLQEYEKIEGESSEKSAAKERESLIKEAKDAPRKAREMATREARQNKEEIEKIKETNAKDDIIREINDFIGGVNPPEGSGGAKIIQQYLNETKLENLKKVQIEWVKQNWHLTVASANVDSYNNSIVQFNNILKNDNLTQANLQELLFLKNKIGKYNALLERGDPDSEEQKKGEKQGKY